MTLRRIERKKERQTERKKERKKLLAGIKVGAGLIKRFSEERMLRLVLRVRHFIC